MIRFEKAAISADVSSVRVAYDNNKWTVVVIEAGSETKSQFDNAEKAQSFAATQTRRLGLSADA
jgi:hypothetical protein